MEKETQMMMTLTSKKKRKKIFSFFIPDDIVIEIFSWLPAKSLLLFRWACKYWFNLITRDDDFIKKHYLHCSTSSSTNYYHQNINNKSLLLTSKNPHIVNCSDFINNNNNNSSPQFYYFSLPVSIDNHTIRAKEERDHGEFVKFESGGSCNGLIFLYSLCDMCYHHFLEYEYFLWNPSTRELKKLPCKKSSEHLHFSSKWSRFHGFGYDHTIDDYKVIDILISYYPLADDVYPEININIYTLGSNSWRTKIDTDHCSKQFLQSKSLQWKKDGCFYNGALHWITEAAIMSFDIVEEEYRQLQLPNYSVGRRRLPSFSKISLCLEVLNGCLCAVVNCFELDTDYLETKASEWNVELWVMKDYGVNESWTKLFTIDSQKSKNICGSRCLNQLKPIELCKNGGILMVFNKRYLVLYDLKNEKHRWVHRIDNFQYVSVVESYIESLVSLKSVLPWYVMKPFKQYCKDGGTLMVFNTKIIVASDPKKNNEAKCVNSIQDVKNGFVNETYIESLVSLNSGMYLNPTESRTNTVRKHDLLEKSVQKQQGR